MLKIGCVGLALLAAVAEKFREFGMLAVEVEVAGELFSLRVLGFEGVSDLLRAYG